MKELTKHSKSTDQISGGIWLVNETVLQVLKLTNANILLPITRVDLQWFVTKFGQVNLVVKTLHMQIWLLR